MKSIINSENGVNNDIKKKSEISATHRTRQKLLVRIVKLVKSLHGLTFENLFFFLFPMCQSHFHPSRSHFFHFFSSMLVSNYFRLHMLENFRS